MQVLLVDDNDALRRALTRTIRGGGFDVEAFPSVEALLARGVPARDACLIVDLDLPGIGAPGLDRELRDSGRRLPTIFITAFEPAGVGPAFPALAPVAVLCKPFDNAVLLEAIGRLAGHTPDKIVQPT